MALKTKKTKTDWGTEEGKAVALIDAIIAICGELSQYMHKHTPAIIEARKDLHFRLKELELDSLFILPNKEEIENRKLISKVASTIRENKIKIKL